MDTWACRAADAKVIGVPSPSMRSTVDSTRARLASLSRRRARIIPSACGGELIRMPGETRLVSGVEIQDFLVLTLCGGRAKAYRCDHARRGAARYELCRGCFSLTLSMGRLPENYVSEVLNAVADFIDPIERKPVVLDDVVALVEATGRD